MSAYLFGTEWRTAIAWRQAKAATAAELRRHTGNLRAQFPVKSVERAGWHLAYQDDIDGKLQAFAHAECDTAEHRAHVERCRAEHLDLEGRPLVHDPLTGPLAEVLA